MTARTAYRITLVGLALTGYVALALIIWGVLGLITRGRLS